MYNVCLGIREIKCYLSSEGLYCFPPQARRRTTTQMELLYANSTDPDAPLDAFPAPLLSISESSEGILSLSSSMDRDLAARFSSLSASYVYLNYCFLCKRNPMRLATALFNIEAFE